MERRAIDKLSRRFPLGRGTFDRVMRGWARAAALRTRGRPGHRSFGERRALRPVLDRDLSTSGHRDVATVFVSISVRHWPTGSACPSRPTGGMDVRERPGSGVTSPSGC